MKNSILVILLLLVVSFAKAQDIETGLVGYYPFNASADDLSPLQNHGAWNGLIERTTNRYELPFTAYEFPNLTTYIDVPDIPELNFTGDFTISVWVRPVEVTTFYMARKSNALAPPYALTLTGIGNTHFAVTTDQGLVTVDVPAGYTLNEWQLFTGVRSGNTLSLYRNNVLIGQEAIMGTNVINPQGLLFNVRTTSSATISPRKLDDVRLYNRALNAAEVNALFEFRAACPIDQLVINSQADLITYKTNYPNCTSLPQGLLVEGEDVNDLSYLSSLLTIYGDLEIRNNPNLPNTDGMELFLEIIDGDWLIVGNGLLDNLMGLSQGLTMDGNTIEIKDNPSLTTLNGFISVRSANVFILDNNDALLSMGDLFLADATNVEIKNNDGITNLSGLGNLTEVNTLIVDNNSSLVSVNGISSIGSPDPIIDTIIITNNEMLTDISNLELFMFEQAPNLTLTDNENLSLCSTFFLCNNIANFSQVIIENNSVGCNTLTELLDNCGASLNYVSGTVKLDIDGTNCFMTGLPGTGAMVEISNGSLSYTTMVEENGNYGLFIPSSGSFTVRIIDSSISEIFTVNPFEEQIEFTGFSQNEIVDFCLSSNENVSDVLIHLLPITEARPGFEAEYILSYANEGSIATSGTISLYFDDERQTFSGATPMPMSISGNEIIWEYETLAPFENRTIALTMESAPPPTNESGTVLWFTSQIVSSETDYNLMDNEHLLEQEMINSQDPNDKRVAQGESIQLSQVGEYLEYIIRFQNIGSASAINVRVDDELQQNLDWNSFKIITASHDFELAITNQNQVSFIFDTINLPSVNTDPEGSNGFIAFRVKSLPGLEIGDFIENEANIFFDFNAPILTNMVTTTVVEILDIQESTLESDVRIFPNPVSENLTILTNPNFNFIKAEVYAIGGQKLMETSATQLDMSDLSAGIYFVTVVTESGSITKKIVKQ